MEAAYARYLLAKKSVDDRALNRQVLAELTHLLPRGAAPRFLEIGAGLGTMVARLLDWQVIDNGDYFLLDVDHQLLDDAVRWLGDWAAATGVPTQPLPDGLALGALRVHCIAAEVADYLQTTSAEPVDVVIAHAFLDLVDVSAILPALFGLLVPGGSYWFTVNFDGETIFGPDHPLDDHLLGAYHQTMDERIRYGRLAGQSRTGRHLFDQLRAAGAPPLAAGSSDWVVYAGPDGNYPADEAVFLEIILQTIQEALDGLVKPEDLAEWLAVRRDQLAQGKLLYIAHQLDFAGRSPA